MAPHRRSEPPQFLFDPSLVRHRARQAPAAILPRSAERRQTRQGPVLHGAVTMMLDPDERSYQGRMRRRVLAGETLDLVGRQPDDPAGRHSIGERERRVASLRNPTRQLDHLTTPEGFQGDAIPRS